MAGSVIVTGARTPIGKLSGGLAPFSAQQLGGFGDLVAAQAGRGGDEVPIQIADMRPPAVEAMRVVGDERFIERTPFHEQMPKSLEQSEIPVDLDRQVQVR